MSHWITRRSLINSGQNLSGQYSSPHRYKKCVECMGESILISETGHAMCIHCTGFLLNSNVINFLLAYTFGKEKGFFCGKLWKTALTAWNPLIFLLTLCNVWHHCVVVMDRLFFCRCTRATRVQLDVSQLIQQGSGWHQVCIWNRLK